jgi:UDP-3-O-[3-hydroxymyristoyl] glucosamine N-acyltransferase
MAPSSPAPAIAHTLAELARLTGAVLDGDGTVTVTHVAPLDSAGPGAIAFLTNPRYRSQLATTRAAAVIVAPAMAGETALPKLTHDNPYATYAKVAALLHPRAVIRPGAHPTAAIAADARVAASAAVGAHAVIGPGAVVGERADIGAGCVIGSCVFIGDDVLLHANVTVYERCVVGPRTIIQSGAVIGADGFGMAEQDGRWLKIPQLGRVVVGADVEIGANTTIDRGAIGDTVIDDDVKLDNQIQIGHNCHIGAHTAIAGCVGVAGSTTIGRNCKIGGAAMISGHLDIPEGTVISAATGVFDSIRSAGVYTGTFPALPHREWRRVAAATRRLRSILERLRALERVRGERET